MSFHHLTQAHVPVSQLLLSKYNVPGPRYTSYPTALLFGDVDDPKRFFKDSKKSKAPLSLYFHIPFCASRCWFCGCHKLITTDSKMADVYLDYLEKEIALTLKSIDIDREVVQIHLGGGTPNFLNEDQTERLGKIIRSSFKIAADAEIGVEFDPRTLTHEKVLNYRDWGVNRASIGIQDCNPEVQQAVHRIQTTEQNLNAVSWLRSAGIQSLNLDLIYGLPYQTVESYADTLKEAISYDPDRFAVFSYAHVPWKQPAQKILEKHSLPSADLKLELLQLILETMQEHDYDYIGMDHFAKKEDPLVVAQNRKSLQRNFQGYSTHANVEICSFGISAIGQSQNVYRQNTKDLNEYYAMLDAGQLPIKKGYMLNEDDQIRRDTIMRIMCDMGLDYDKISNRWNIQFKDYFAKSLKALESFQQDGLVEIGNKAIQVTEAGRYFIRNIAMQFDAYLSQGPKGYSKTV